MPATLNAGVFVLTGLSNEVNNRFLYQYLCTEKLMKYAEKTSTGGTIQHLNQGVLVNFPIPIPPLKEQKGLHNLFLTWIHLLRNLSRPSKNIGP